MIGKIIKGADFRALLAYLTRDGRGDVLAYERLCSDTPAEAASEMALAAGLSQRSKKPLMHIIVSYPPGETPSDDECRAAAREVLAGLRMADNQAVVIRHHDTHHAHFHIAVNRIGSNGRAVSDSKSYARVESVLRGVETRRGMTATPGRHAHTHGIGLMSGPRSSRDPRQHSAPEAVRQILIKSKSWDEMHEGLAEQGWRLDITSKAGRQSGAVLLGPDGQKIAGGSIDRAATLWRIRARMDKYSLTNSHDCHARAAESALAKPGHQRESVGPSLSNALLQGLTRATTSHQRIQKLPTRSGSVVKLLTRSLGIHIPGL